MQERRQIKVCKLLYMSGKVRKMTYIAEYFCENINAKRYFKLFLIYKINQTKPLI